MLILRGQVALAANPDDCRSDWLVLGEKEDFPIRKSSRYLFCLWWQARSLPPLISPATALRRSTDSREGYGWKQRAGRRQLSGNDVRRRGVPDVVGSIRLACRHADDGDADYGAVIPAVAHYGADANSAYPACSGVRLCAKEEAGAPNCWY